jgi:hypothetical protein
MPSLLMLILRRNIPESPRWQLLWGGEQGADDARKTLLAIAEENGVSDELREKIRRARLVRPEVEEREVFDLASYMQVIVHPYLGPITAMLCGIWFFHSSERRADVAGAAIRSRAPTVAGVLFIWLPLYLAENAQFHTVRACALALTHARLMRARQDHKEGMQMGKAYMAALLIAIVRYSCAPKHARASLLTVRVRRAPLWARRSSLASSPRWTVASCCAGASSSWCAARRVVEPSLKRARVRVCADR